MDTSSLYLFTHALGNISPWEVKDITFSKNAKGISELQLTLNFEAGSLFINEKGESVKAYDTEWYEWRHLNFFEHNCIIKARVPRIADGNGTYKRCKVPWSNQMNGFTLKFEAHILSLIKLEMPISGVGRLVGEEDKRIWRVLARYVTKAREVEDYTNITEVGIDETSERKGHNYVTVGVDLPNRRVFDVQNGKDKEAVAGLGRFLDEHGSHKENVKQVSIDMSPSFIAGCTETFTNAAITFDHFHVTKEVNKAMDELRKLERKENVELKGHKYLFLKNSKALSEKRKAELELLAHTYPKLGEGYRLKEQFKEFWLMTDVVEATAFLEAWCTRAIDSKIIPFAKAVKTIKSHWSGIINYVKSQISNGILEGINSKIQLAKKRARGYRNQNNFITIILFTCGKLKLDWVHCKLSHTLAV
jgi:transposase